MSPCFTVLTEIMKLYEGWIFARFTLSIYTAANISGTMNVTHTALLWQKEASDKRDISCKRAKCICHFHWRQWNIMIFYFTYLLIAGWVFMHKIWPGRRAHWVKYENINNSDLHVDGMSLASFWQSRAAQIVCFHCFCFFVLCSQRIADALLNVWGIGGQWVYYGSIRNASALHWYYVPLDLLYGHVRHTQTAAQTNKTLAVTLYDKDET